MNKGGKRKRKRQTKKQTLNYGEETHGCQREEGEIVMGIKEGTCDEHWVLHVSDESLNSTPKTNITLCVK